MTTKAVNRVFRVTALVGNERKTFSMVVPAATSKKAAKQSVIARFGAHRVVSVK
ncbi:hypothetical protein K1Y77_17080 (plasmid) [Halomonas qaidamensis]|uniref:50S ribosomal protein L23 n=1 Tax=Halomonas qaidamensis TaxID=2866211 RepID=A0ABY6JUG2_9GAMM|nr:hypothetical protein [Halomonas qaidamensis]UYV20933.1 hypothetical protein K1Y77_17080 [Halomonas qaidamensis]